MPDIELLDRVWFGNSLRQWLFALSAFGVAYLLLSLLRRFSVRRLGVLAARSATHLDDLGVEIIRRTRQYFLLVVSFNVAARLIHLSTPARDVVHAITVVAVLLQAGRWGSGLIGFAVEHYSRKRGDGDAGTRATIQAVGYAGRFALWVILLITALSAFGIDITALITGLGIGGIALALAVQNILGDLFAALSIVLDKPFVVGDPIQVDAINGTIEHVGLKTTRIRSLSGEQVIISNADLLRSRIRNYKRMEQRRAVFTLDLAFDTPADKVAAIPAMVRKIVEAQPLARFDRSHFLAIDESGLRVESVYFVLDADFNRYADIQQAINLELLRQLQRDRIQFGYDTRLVNLRQTPNDQAI